MGLFDKIFGDQKTKSNKSNESKTPILDEKFHSLMGLEFGMYLSWVEDTTKKTIMGKELQRRIKMFLKKEKKLGHIEDFNQTDINYISIVAISSDIKTMQKERKKNKLDSRWPLMEKHIGLKK
jgi:hypothetical protein|tara:strand:+ start:554 stop:922 length:369 start_codon:yes stop_codon:yes gene_type:complete